MLRITTMIIRPITKEDLEEYMQMAKEFYSMPCCDHVIDPSHFSNAFEYSLSDNPYTRLFMIECDGKIAGYSNISLTYSIEAGGNVVWLEEIYIKPEYRNKGLGSALFEYVYKNYPAKRYRMEVTDSNQEAIKLYKKLGYEFLDYKQMIKDEN